MGALVAFCDRAAWPIIILAVVMSAISVVTAVRGLGFATNRNDLIGENQDYHQSYQRFKQEFPQEDDIVLIVVGPNAATNRRAVDQLGNELRADPAHFSDIYDRLNLDFVRQRLLLFMSVSDLQEVAKRIKDVKPFLKRLMSDPGLVPLFASINDEIQAYIKAEIERAMQGRGASSARNAEDAPDIAGSLPILTSILDDMSKAAKGRFKYRSPWGAMFSASKSSQSMQDIPRDVYLEYQDGHMFLVALKPVMNKESFTPSEDVLRALRTLVAKVQAQYPGIEIGMTGEPVLENDEMQASSRDAEIASVVSLVLIAILFAFTFSTLGRPLMGIMSLVLAMGWTLGFATVAIGHLNILTVTCMPMLIGLGIDFGIQVISRYDEEMLDGGGTDPMGAMTAALEGTGMSIITAAITTSVSFAAAWLTGFKGVGELGLLAGGGLMLSLLAMIVVLPAMLLLADRRRIAREGRVSLQPSPLQGLSKVESVLLGHPWGVLVLGVILTIVCSMHARNVTFDYNLLHLQSKGVESVEWENRLVNGSGQDVLFAAVVANDLKQARLLEKKLATLPTVKSVESVAPMFPEDQEAKLAIIPRIHRVLSDIPPLKEPLPRVDVPKLQYVVADLRSIFFLIYPEVREAGEMEITRQIRQFVLACDLLLDRIEKAGTGNVSSRLFRYQSDFFHDLADKLSLIRGDGQVEPMDVDKMPLLLRRTMMGKNGRFLLRVFPKEKIWDPEPLKRFLDDIDRVVHLAPSYAGPRLPYSTGTPVMMYNSTRLLVQSYVEAGWYAFAVIVVCVLLHFRSLLPSLLALVPLGIGMVWMEGIQGFFGISFNPANYMVLPLILGIGVANGIYVVRRFQEEGHASVFQVSTGRAILLSNLTAMIGFGSLMIAKYQGIFTLGLVMTIGIGTCMTAALVLLPVLLQLLARFGVRI